MKAMPLLDAKPPTCGDCPARSACLAALAAGTPAAASLQRSIVRTRLRSGDPLPEGEDGERMIFVVRGGTLKTVQPMADGGEHVAAFHLAGDLVGLDGLGQAQPAPVTRALELSQVCGIPYAELMRASTSAPLLRERFWSAMSAEIVRNQQVTGMLAGMRAERRVAAFLLDVSRRMDARGYSPRDFHMRFMRREIGSYLGLRLETVSRSLTSLEQQRLVEVSARHIRILDYEGLAAQGSD